jgi:hypothetical protein
MPPFEADDALLAGMIVRGLQLRKLCTIFVNVAHTRIFKGNGEEGRIWLTQNAQPLTFSSQIRGQSELDRAYGQRSNRISCIRREAQSHLALTSFGCVWLHPSVQAMQGLSIRYESWALAAGWINWLVAGWVFAGTARERHDVPPHCIPSRSGWDRGEPERHHPMLRLVVSSEQIFHTLATFPSF